MRQILRTAKNAGCQVKVFLLCLFMMMWMDSTRAQVCKSLDQLGMKPVTKNGKLSLLTQHDQIQQTAELTKIKKKLIKNFPKLSQNILNRIQAITTSFDNEGWSGDFSWQANPVFIKKQNKENTQEVIKIGPVFGALYKKDPQRYRYEVTRSLAEVLSPCENQNQKLFECLKLNYQEVCFPKTEQQMRQTQQLTWSYATYVADQVYPKVCSTQTISQEMLACFKQ
jgi:hypothetical protein